MQSIIKQHPIIAIMRNVPLKQTIPYGEAVVNGGIKAIEVALNSEDAFSQIMMLKQHFGASVHVGAGTVVTVQKACCAVSAGADFMLSPSADREVLQYCHERKIPFLPGVMTPSDVNLCVQFDFHLLKLFPAGNLPLSYIHSLKGPFEHTNYVAVGGVTRKNVLDFFRSGFVGVGIGSNLIPKSIQEREDWAAAEQAVKEFVFLANHMLLK